MGSSAEMKMNVKDDRENFEREEWILFSYQKLLKERPDPCVGGFDASH
jgi:hypothetical protein